MSTPTDLLLHVLTTSEGRNDPFPIYRQLLRGDRIFRAEPLGMWCVSRFDECREVLRSTSFGKGEGQQHLRFPDGSVRERAAGTPSILRLNPPDHTRIRGLVSRAFTPKRMQELRPSIEALTDELLDDLGAPGDEVDLISKFAFQLPVRVIAAMLGVPDEDRDWFRPRTAALVRSLEPAISVDEFDASRAAYSEVYRYMGELINDKRAAPGDDLLSALIAVEAEGDRLSEDELISNAILMFTAGFETTTNLIGNGVAALLAHPAQQQAVADDPSLWATAVEEILRFDGPVQLDGRIALEDTAIAGQPIAAGDMVTTLLGAANRDRLANHDPDTFDVSRSDIAILSFASGIHFCLGASLARLEGEVALGRLFGRFPDLQPGRIQPQRNDAITIRGYTSLPVRL